MTNEDLTVLILDKLNWDYDKGLNPGRYKNTKELLAGDTILALLNFTSIDKAALSLKVSYKVLYTAVSRYLTPIFGKINGGEETWAYILTHYIEVRNCTNCSKILPYSEFHIASTSSRGVHHVCKCCRVEVNAETYKKDSTKESHQKSYDKNYGKIRERQNKYKGERSLRIPPWSETTRIADFYTNCPEGCQVDHIIPLKGELISGLHVIENLQYLSAQENMQKGNRFQAI